MGIVVSFATEKGGSKKTTQNEIISEIFSDLGYNVCILDCDPQQTISKWVERRNALIDNFDEDDKWLKKIDLVTEFDQKIFYNTIECLRLKYDVIVIDTPGRDSEFLRETYFSADIIYIPVTPVQNDIETMPSILNLLKRTTLRNPQPAIIRTMLVDVPTHHQDSSKMDAITRMTDFGLLKHAPLSTASTKKRKIYSVAQTHGLTGYSIRNSMSNLECNELKKEVVLLIKELIERNA